jgi:uncharacterized tellurite resistance protein B-like protein
MARIAFMKTKYKNPRMNIIIRPEQAHFAAPSQLYRTIMLKKLKDFFTAELQLDDKTDPDKALQQACAMLLMEVSKADYDLAASEKDKIMTLLTSLFDLSTDTLAELVKYSETKSEEHTSVYPFTSLINDHYEYEQRVNLVSLMWKVAYADGDLDKYEDSVIRKVADLMYIRHSDFVKTKLAAAEANKQ